MNVIATNEAKRVKDDFAFIIFLLKLIDIVFLFNVINSYAKYNYSISISAIREKRLPTKALCVTRWFVVVREISLSINLRELSI